MCQTSCSWKEGGKVKRSEQVLLKFNLLLATGLGELALVLYFHRLTTCDRIIVKKGGGQDFNEG
jgi:hypothetical protein